MVEPRGSCIVLSYKKRLAFVSSGDLFFILITCLRTNLGGTLVRQASSRGFGVLFDMISCSVSQFSPILVSLCFVVGGKILVSPFRQRSVRQYQNILCILDNRR